MTLQDSETRSHRGRSHHKQTETKQQRAQRLATDNDAIWTFKEWCAVNGISVRTGRRLLQSGRGPVVTMLRARGGAVT